MPHSEEISRLTLNAILGSALDAVVAVDRNSVVVAWNENAERTFGWTQQDAVGRPLAELIIPSRHRDGHARGMQRYQDTGVASVLNRRIEISAINREGREFPIELSIVPAPPGGPAAFIGFLRDVSDRLHSQRRLAVSEESLRLATESAEVGTWDLDLLTDVLTWSDRTKAMFGISPGVPCSMRDFYGGLHPDDLAATSEAFASALNPDIRATYDVEYRTVGKEDGRIRWVAAKGKGIFDDRGRCVRAVGTAIDITSRKLASANEALMLQLIDRLRDRDTNIALNDACALMGKHFGASRTGYGQLDAVKDEFSYTVCWTDGTVPPLLGEFPAHAFGKKIVARLSAGNTVAISNLFTDELSDEAETRETAKAVATSAILVVPFLRGHRLRTIIYLNSRGPRDWSRDDIVFIEELAERVRQVIERADAEAALAATEAEFRTFAQAMPNHVWASSPDGMLDWFNDRVYAYGGARHGELNGTGWAAMVHPEDLEDASQRWAAALASGETYETEFRLRRADGSYRWHLARALPIRRADGKIVRWIGTNTDIEDQKVATKALADLNAGLEQEVAARTADRDRVWRNSQDLLVVVDPAGIFRAVSPSVYRILGWQPEDLIGKRAFDFIFPEDIPATTRALEQAVQRGLDGVFENRFCHKDGSVRWLSWVAAPESGLVYGSGRHITAEKTAAEELARAQEALRQSQKMEAVGQLTGGIAHDFNNMLAVVIGSLDLLKRRIDPQEANAVRYIDAATEGARRAALLTQRLLAFSRQQPLKPQTTNVNALVAGMSDLLRHSLGSDVKLETVLAGGLWRTHVDPNQLENVILNLAVNARDAMPEGGRLTIETLNAHLDQRYVTAEPGMSAGQYVLIAVTDTGTGMSSEVIAKAFDPFFTTKAVGKGTGLGLSQVYGFIKQSGGHVKIYSEPGEGTAVKLYLPRYFASETEVAVAREMMLPRGNQGELVLVVEDEQAVRHYSVEALGELGYRVLEADGAAAALQILDANTDITLLFTDVVMPDVNGKKLADEARRRRPGLKVLFTTGYTRNAVVHNGALDRGVEMISKPFTLDELALKVRQVLDE